MAIDTKKILLEQVKELEKLLELKTKRIEELEALIGRNVMFPKQTEVYMPSVWTVCQHEYPNPWGGITPPHCKKCGQQSAYGTNVTSGSVFARETK